MTSSNGNIFRVTGHLSPVPGEFPAQRPVTGSYDVFFDLRPNKRLSKQSRGWWFEAPSLPLWRHRNDSSSYMVATTDKGYVMFVYTYKYRFNVSYVFILACCSLASLLDSVSLVSSISWTCFWTHTSDLSVSMLTLEIWKYCICCFRFISYRCPAFAECIMPDEEAHLSTESQL